MSDLINVNYNADRPTVSARELHRLLEIRTAFKDWFPRVCEKNFIPNIALSILNTSFPVIQALILSGFASLYFCSFSILRILQSRIQRS